MELKNRYELQRVGLVPSRRCIEQFAFFHLSPPPPSCPCPPPSHDHPLIGSSLPCQYQLFTSTPCSRKLLPFESCQFIEIHELFKIEQQESDPGLKHITCCTRHCPCSCPPSPIYPPHPLLISPSLLLSLTGQGSMAQCRLTQCEDEDVMGQKTVKILHRRTKDISSAVGASCVILIHDVKRRFLRLLTVIWSWG